ncbi:MAG: hypothetical protein KA746_03955 [Pyrinomonadaceae bacterium]|nr:hypothetical protein [Pyrinomonadaceae bacterium]MBP6211425.1 hypothetical protein [Pyrinomonadaceae bacterium]
MYKIIKNLAMVFTVAVTLAFSANAQNTEKKLVVNPDGTYSVIEYPVGKEVIVNLVPMTGLTSTGTARVVRTVSGTKVYFDLAGAPADWKNVYAYAVDPSGSTSVLGPIQFMSGMGKAEFDTPLNQFMLVLSPVEGLSTYDATSPYVFRSEAPKGYAIVPRTITDTTKAVAGTQLADASYNVPMLGVPKFEGKTTEVRVKFGGELSGLDGKAYLKPEGGKTSIKMRFGDMKKVPMNTRMVLWASGTDGSYIKIGQVINTGSRDEAEIRGETALADFGLLVTIEDVDVTRPTSRIFSTFMVNP